MAVEYQNNCRFCLKSSKKMLDLFTYILQPKEVCLVDFVRKITDLKVIKGEYLPNKSCMSCINSISDAYAFIQMCIVSEEILKKQETRREFRKIEQEALLDENEILSDEQIESEGQDVMLSFKCEDTVLQETPNVEPDDFSDFSDANSGITDTEKHCEKIEVGKLPIKVNEKYSCNTCQMKFSNKMKFLGHQKMHDETKPFKCFSCAQNFSKEAYLRVHLRSHAKSEEKKYSCDICGKHFIYEYLLKQHRFKHSDRKPFPCSKCDKGCLTSENLRRHMKTHDENYAKKIYCCTICRKEFPYPSSLSEHMKLHTGEKPHLCCICGKGFRQSGSLHFHQRIHTGIKPFKCDVCSDSFKSRSLLKVHMRKHTNERPFVCDSCGVGFRRSNDLKCHIRTHTGERPVLCTLCGKMMRTTGQLTVHLRTHTGEKPYKCETCDKTFTTKTVLLRHERIHSGERPYTCTVCNKTFNQSSSLKVHSNIHCSKPETERVRKRNPRKILPKEQATVTIKVDDEEKIGSNVRTEFTVILPAPIPPLPSD